MDCKTLTSASDDFNELHFIKFVPFFGVCVCKLRLPFSVRAAILPFSICSFVQYYISNPPREKRTCFACWLPSEMQVIHNCSSAHCYIELSFVNKHTVSTCILHDIVRFGSLSNCISFREECLASVNSFENQPSQQSTLTNLNFVWA